MRKLRISLPIGHYVDFLQAGIPFKFSRWGDGEIIGLRYGSEARQVGHRKNANGTSYTEELKMGLGAAIAGGCGETDFLGLLGIAVRTFRPWLEEFTRSEEVNWVNGDVILNAVVKKQFGEMLEELRSKPVVYVGRMGLNDVVSKAFPNLGDFVSIPSSDSYKHAKKIANVTNSAADKCGAKTVLVSAGMGANVIIPLLNKETTAIDMGSIMDGFSGAVTRSYIQRHDFKELGDYYGIR